MYKYININFFYYYCLLQNILQKNSNNFQLLFGKNKTLKKALNLHKFQMII